MKVLIINGSPRRNGNTAIALKEMEKIFAEEGVETEIVQIGNKAIRGSDCQNDKVGVVSKVKSWLEDLGY